MFNEFEKIEQFQKPNVRLSQSEQDWIMSIDHFQFNIYHYLISTLLFACYNLDCPPNSTHRFGHEKELFFIENDCHEQSSHARPSKSKNTFITSAYAGFVDMSFHPPLFSFVGHYCDFIIYERSFWFWSAWQLPAKLAALHWRERIVMERLLMASRRRCSFLRPSCRRRYW